MNHQTLAWAANIIYEPLDIAARAFDLAGFPNFVGFDKNATQAAVVGNDEFIIITWRGTKGGADVIVDLNASYQTVEGNDEPDKSYAHQGFYDYFDEIWDELYVDLLRMRDNNQKVIPCGHSLGATGARHTQRKIPFFVDECVTFGEPRSVNKRLANHMIQECIRYNSRSTRYVNHSDGVTRIPSDLRFEHMPDESMEDVGIVMRYFDFEGKLQTEDTDWGIRVSEMGSDHSMDDYEDLLKRHNL